MIYLTSWLWYIQSCKALPVQSSVKIKPKSSVWLKRDLGSMHSECPCAKTASIVLQHSSSVNIKVFQLFDLAASLSAKRAAIIL